MVAKNIASASMSYFLLFLDCSFTDYLIDKQIKVGLKLSLCCHMEPQLLQVTSFLNKEKMKSYNSGKIPSDFWSKNTQRPHHVGKIWKRRFFSFGKASRLH